MTVNDRLQEAIEKYGTPELDNERGFGKNE